MLFPFFVFAGGNLNNRARKFLLSVPYSRPSNTLLDIGGHTIHELCIIKDSWSTLKVIMAMSASVGYFIQKLQTYQVIGALI